MPRLEDRLHVLAYQRCIPLSATIETTLRCNIRCVHCYNFDRAEPYAPSRARAELTRDEVLGAIDQLRAIGTLSLTFSGGEATLHPDLPDFVARAADRHCTAALITNGTALGAPGYARRLAGAGLTAVSISLYGATPAVHDAFTATPGALARSLAGAAAARDAGLSVTLRFMLVRSNAHELDAMFALADRLGLFAQIDCEITGRYDGDRSTAALRVTPEQLAAAYRHPRMRDSVLKETAPPPGDRFIQCNCARSKIAITAFGDVLPCIAAPLPAGNLRDRPLEEIWRDSPVFRWIRALQQADFKTCTPCPHRAWCRRTSGSVYSSTGDYTGIDPWICGEAEVIHRMHAEAGARSPTSEVQGPKSKVGSAQGAAQGLASCE